MRRIFHFIAAFVLLLAPIGAAGQSMYVNREEWGEPEPLSLRKRIEKPGMTAEQIFRAFLFPRNYIESLVGGLYSWNALQSYRQIVFHFGKAEFSYDYYIYAFDGFYIVSIEDIFVQRGGHHFTIHGVNETPFKREYSKQDYALAIKIIDYLRPKLDDLCSMLEEKAFPLLVETK